MQEKQIIISVLEYLKNNVCKCSMSLHTCLHSDKYTGSTHCVFPLIIMWKGGESFREFTVILKKIDIIIYPEQVFSR